MTTQRTDCRLCGALHFAKGLCKRCYQRATYTPSDRTEPTNHRLTADDVRRIRQLRDELGYTYRELARMFGVSIPTIGFVVTRKTWTNV
ncbi:helix-turn-helix domain-containing protein [Mycobacterium sp. LTG2003]